MANTFAFYHDVSLTQPINSGAPLTATQDTANLLAAVDKTIYLGSTEAGKKLQTAVSPGVNPVVVSIVDADAGSGAPATEFRLSLSAITGAETPGASLNLSHTLTSGVGNAIPIYTRRDSVLTTAGAYTDVSIQVVDVNETAV